MAFSCESINNNMPSSKTILSTAASLVASAIVARTIANDLVPDCIQNYFSGRFRRLSNRLSSQLTIVIDEFDGLTSNLMFEAARVYLGTKVSPSTQRIKANKPHKDDDLVFSVDKDQDIVDVYENVTLKWVLQSTVVAKPSSNSKKLGSQALRYFELTFGKKHKQMVCKNYLPHVLREAKKIMEENKTVKLHTVDYNGTDYWGSVAMKHPATFDTIAMDPDTKTELLEDLHRFVSGKEYYKRVGKAWKRGYLFYGPPGTGKSSLVAAMASYLKFDVYDLDLKEVQCNSDLRRLMIGMASRSILVIEDIDCNVGVQNREPGNVIIEEDKITLSGLLNFIDGLWSSCEDERIIVFTTNHKDRLDPALLRPGRMDVHLEMSYCTFSGFKILASNYLKTEVGREEHPLFGVIKELLVKVQITPAEVAGELMKSDNIEIALQNLIKLLHSRETEHA